MWVDTAKNMIGCENAEPIEPMRDMAAGILHADHADEWKTCCGWHIWEDGLATATKLTWSGEDV